MAPVAAVARRGKIALEVREQRARDVRGEILLLAELRLRQVMAAIEDPPGSKIFF